GVNAVAYSPDGEQLAAANSDGTVGVWDLTTGASRSLTGHTRWVSAVAYSPDGTHVATASGDDTVRVWDLTTGASRTLTGHTRGVNAVAYSPDGTHLATGSDDSTVRIWAGAGMTPREMIKLICVGLLRRDLTSEERARYLPSTDTSPDACPPAR
ncbi:WD40 repeat domain-containing protein, partial [Actinoplanes subglobosus]